MLHLRYSCYAHVMCNFWTQFVSILLNHMLLTCTKCIFSKFCQTFPIFKLLVQLLLTLPPFTDFYQLLSTLHYCSSIKIVLIISSLLILFSDVLHCVNLLLQSLKSNLIKIFQIIFIKVIVIKVNIVKVYIIKTHIIAEK